MEHCDVAACTVVAKTHLPYARVLAGTLREHHPGIPVYVLLADEVEGRFDPSREPYTLLPFETVVGTRLDRVRFMGGKQPTSYAATPFLIAHLLASGCRRVAFFKQESLVTGDHKPFFDALARHPIVLTPHLLAPLEGTDAADRELQILLAGAFNGGLVGVARGDVGRAFLAWWQDRVGWDCRHAVEDGMHFEQRWLDLVLSYFPQAHSLRDPSFNVGHWNLPERTVTVRDGLAYVFDQPGRLFRFSGYDPNLPEQATRYFSRLDRRTLGPAMALFDGFRRALESAGWRECQQWPYAWDRFDNGVPVPDIVRAVYAALAPEAAERFGNPLRTRGPDSFWSWLHAPADDVGEPSLRVTRFWKAIYDLRLDVQRAYPDVFGGGRHAFLAWTGTSGTSEYALSDTFRPATWQTS